MHENQYHKKIERISIVDQVGDAIKQMILTGQWKTGDKLPAEAEIAQMYGVNRLSVRMALQKLITLGVIETRVGEGSFVRDFSMYPVLGEIADYYDCTNRIEDIQEMRRLIENESAVKATYLAEEDDLATLRQCLENYHQMAEKLQRDDSDENFNQLVDADFEFHAQIVHMSKNAIFEEVYFMIQKLVTGHIASLINHRRYFEENPTVDYIKTHDDLYAGICAHDAEAVRRATDIILDVDTLR